MIHQLKTIPPYFDDILAERKSFEVRRESDRRFVIGDDLILREWDRSEYTGRIATVRVVYVLRDPELCPGFVVLGIRLLPPGANVPPEVLDEIDLTTGR